ncbi:hypothetical protein O181_052811 [Austropuccinia psidii MF-1]|uniref:Uncharacterized protein n=1 Tax=Austropuccinia psidii MF-1 TaxID=1389203 RepID=A0A9Q3E6D1_9BASI|nr:hypothetical protein [Austropuccinia psidii MF-1]
MECWSENANVFFFRVDEGISKAEEASGKRSLRREHHIPAPGKGSIRKTFHNQLPIDFYDPDWFNNWKAGQKSRFADVNQVASFPDSSKCLLGKQHPDERLSDKKFSQEYWDQIIEPYNISHVIENDDGLDVDSNTNDKSCELEDIVAEEFEEKNVEESKPGNTHMEQPNDSSEDIEMEDCEDDNTPQQSQQSFFRIPNEWRSW